MATSDRVLIAHLISTGDFDRSYATAFISARGRCTYCGHDLLRSWPGYLGSVVDHLLPTGTYSALRSCEQNWTLSCSMCNTIKGGIDLLPKGENPETYLKANRDQLIAKAKEHIAGKRAEWRRIWEELNVYLDEALWESD